jgi:DNA-3-methyladenine glycosylase II
MTIGAVIKSQDCVDTAALDLIKIAPIFQTIVPDLSPLPLRLRGDGFEALLSAIVSQQISVASAASVWAKLSATNMTNPENVAGATDDDLRALGLSRPKVKYAKSLADADIDYPALWHQPNADVMAQLTTVKGIGRWTAEIYLMFSLGRADILPVGDIALQEAAKVLFNLDARPTEPEFDKMAADWAPWRSIAARALWAYYAQLKNREGIRT